MASDVVPVTTDNFARAETHRVLADFQRMAGGVTRFTHLRRLARVDERTVVRMNRDTLYSAAVVDLSAGATLTVPDAGERYLSVTAVDEDHYVNRVFYEPGEHELTAEELGTPYVALVARTLVDPRFPDDLAAAHAVQDGLALHAGSQRPFEMPPYDLEALDRTRTALLGLVHDATMFGRAFGRRDEVDPVRHLVATALGWGGMPDTEITYVSSTPGLPVGDYEVRVGPDVPVDGFWSISVYDSDGYFVPNAREAYTVNSITAARDADGGVTVHFGGDGDPEHNSLPITEGWTYLVRLYQPRPEVLRGTWTFPAVSER